jgi:hypothetical protein
MSLVGIQFSYSSSNNGEDIITTAVVPLINGVELHRLAFANELAALQTLLEAGRHHINAQDAYGNTALQIAVLLQHTEMITLLLEHGALIGVPNKLGWTCLSEAVSIGNRAVMSQLLLTAKSRAVNKIREHEREIHKKIRDIGDVTLVLQYKLASWLPFVGRVLPFDTVTIRKKGTSVRLDMTLRDFENLSWVRGDVSLLFKANLYTKNQGFAFDNNTKTVQELDLTTKESKKKQHLSELDANMIQHELDQLMSQPIKSMTSPGMIKFKRAKQGVIGFRRPKTEHVLDFKDCRVFNVENIQFSTKLRFEHMNAEDIKKHKARSKILQTPTLFDKELKQDLGKTPAQRRADLKARVHRSDLSAPPKHHYSAETYFDTHKKLPEEPRYPDVHLGRPKTTTEENKKYTAGVSMCDDFPITVQEVISILEMVGEQHMIVAKLTEFLSSRLPEGFPVKVWFPVAPTITATLNFVDFSRETLDPSIFHFEGYSAHNSAAAAAAAAAAADDEEEYEYETEEQQQQQQQQDVAVVNVDDIEVDDMD